MKRFMKYLNYLMIHNIIAEHFLEAAASIQKAPSNCLAVRHGLNARLHHFRATENCNARASNGALREACHCMIRVSCLTNPPLAKSFTSFVRAMTQQSAAPSKIVRVDIVSDTVCPWCFVGKKNLDKAISSCPDVDVKVRDP